MTYNTASGQTPEELLERAVGALVREWGITEDEARAALERARTAERRLGRELAREQAWAEHPTGRAS